MRKKKGIPLSPVLEHFKLYFETLALTTEEYLYVTDYQNKIVMLSPNVVRDFNIPSTVLRSLDEYWVPLIHPEDRPVFEQAMKAMLVERTTDMHDVHYRMKNRKGEYIWIHCVGRLALTKEGEVSLFVGSMKYMGQPSQADPVTGLLNKYQFERAVQRALKHYRENGETGALIVFGLDNFKIVNETYNRSFGDQVLKSVAEQVVNILPRGLKLYKLDGDEFGLIYPQATQAEIDDLFASAQKCMMRPQSLEGRMYFCTLSAGTVTYPQYGKDYLVLHKHVEAALDMAKRSGKNKNYMFTKDNYNRWVRSIAMRDDLRVSVENGCRGFNLFFQPQITVDGQRLIGAEALLRWKNPKGRMVAPMEFIPILEETKLIIPVGKWIVEQAIKTCRKWQQRIPDFEISINVSHEQMKDMTFKTFVCDCIERYGIRPESVVLELTESRIVSDWSYVNREFDYFRSRGIHIAMDDFGTGYSSLAYLKNLSCDIVKLDREFVKNILQNDFDRQLVEYTVKLCHSIGITACVEGVEQQDEYDLLTQDCKVDMCQGYLFGHPESEENFEKFFTELNI